MAPPPPIESALKLGFRFEPKPEDAVTYYLPRLLAGVPMHATIAPFIHCVDIYACEPGVLAAQFRPTPKAGDRFFFTTCKRQRQKAGKTSRGVRAAGPGHWHSQGHTTDVLDDDGVKAGEARKFRYKKGGAFTDWLMDEFSSCAANTVDGDKQYVLCKIYVSPRAGPDSAARQESDAFVAFAPPPPPDPEEQEPVAVARNNNINKRPAPPVAEPPRPAKRIRPAAIFPTPPPVVPPPLPSPVQASCSTIAVRDPFCTETDPPAAAAQEDDGADFDADFFESLDGSLEPEQGAPLVAEPPRHEKIPTPPPMEPPSPLPVQAPVPHRCSPPQPSIQASMAAPTRVAARDPFRTKTESPAAAAQEDDDNNNTGWLASLKLITANQQVRKNRDPFESFDPTIGRKAKPMMMPAY